MATEQVQVQIVLDDGSIQKGFFNIEKKAQDSAKSIEGTLGKSFNQFSVIAGVVSSALGAISLKKAIDESIQAENASIKLQLALRNVGLATRENVNSFSNFASELEKTTGIQSDVITENASLLVSLGKLSGEGLNRATKAAVDLSKGLGIDLNSAFDIVGKASAGNVGALGRYGLKVDEVGPKSERFANALGLIEQRFGGMAKTIADSTFEGALNKLNVSFTNFFETTGKFITNSPVIRESIKFVTEAIDRLNQSIEKTGKQSSIDGFIKQVVNDLLPTFQILTTAGEIFFRSLYTGFKALQFIVQSVIALMANAGNAFVQSTVTPILDFVTNGLSGVVGLLDKQAGKDVEALGKNISDKMKSFSATVAESTAAVATDSYNALSEATQNTFSTSISDSINAFAENYKNRINEVVVANNNLVINSNQTGMKLISNAMTVSSGFSNIFTGMKTAAQDFADTARVNFANVGKAMFNSVGTGAANAFAAFGKAAAKGENALKAFGDALLSALGQMAIQMGSQFILQGIAYMFAGLPNGPALIAAGAALAAFGGILSASGGGVAGATPAAGTATAGGGLVIEQGGFQPDQQEMVKPGNVVNLTVEGSILDTAETGLRLSRILSDSFQNQGTTLVNA